MSEQEQVSEWPHWEFGINWLHPCAFHVGELEIDPIDEEGNNIPACPECGCLLETEDCSWCGAEWIAFGTNWIDDTMRSAAINETGDLMCARCFNEEEEEIEMENSDDWQDDYP